jgi:hypothetical protein
MSSDPMFTSRSKDDKIAFDLVKANDGDLFSESKVDVCEPEAFLFINVSFIYISNFFSEFRSVIHSDRIPF